MNIDKKGFRYRLSNVLAWFGLLNLGFWFFVGYVSSALIVLPLIVSIGSWLFFGLINYLMVGSLRLLPWRDIE
jgi:hypothetical protein